MSDPDPFERLLQAAELRRTLAESTPAEQERLLEQHADLRELIGVDQADGGEEGATADAPEERTIAGFRLLRELGRGGMGIVYEALDPSLARRVALKLLSPALASDPASIARFRREATLAAGLEHPALARVYDFVEDRDANCLVMEFVDGVSLDHMLTALRNAAPAADTLPSHEQATRVLQTFGIVLGERSYETFVASMVAQLADGLHYAHAAGVIHRDVKPANILLRQDGQVVLTDFGLARQTGREGVTVTGELTGTPAYQSPEQIAGEASTSLGPATDLFSLGITLYELLSLQRPFDGDSVMEIQQGILRERPTPLPRLNPQTRGDLATIVGKSLQKRPDDRYPDLQLFAADLRRYLAARAVQAKPLPPHLRLHRWATTKPLLATLCALAVAATIAIATSWWRASAALADYRWLAAGLRVTALQSAWRDAPPAWPEHQERFAKWRQEAEVLQSWLPRLTDRVQKLEQRAVRMPDGKLRFESIESQFLYEGNVHNLEALRDLQSRVVPELEANLAWANSVQKQTIDDHRQAWGEVLADLANDARFAGVALSPQLGLVPLGRSAHSGLWEFAHLRSGRPADLAAPPGQRIDGATGIVFVLVPPMSFQMGCQSTQPDAPNFDPRARDRDGPVHRVQLHEPFLLSKFELSRGQWRRLGAALSVTDAKDTHADEELDSYPLIGQSHEEVAYWLQRHGLALPTEAQWELCCRAGSRTRWCISSREQDLAAFANVRDLDLFDQRDAVMPPSAPPYAQIRDGYARQAPVDSLLANAWGFHQMHGNVVEMCRDWLSTDYRTGGTARDADGLRPGRSTARVVRGGSYLREAWRSGSGIRNGAPPGARIRSIGVRPARPWQTP